MPKALIIDTAGGANANANHLRNLGSLHVGGAALATSTLQVTGTVAISSTLSVVGVATLDGDVVTDIIRRATSDGSDNEGTVLTGGGADGVSRGARVRVFGNEHATAAGDLDIEAGNVAGGQITFKTSDTERMRIENGGNVVVAGQFSAASYATPGLRVLVGMWFFNLNAGGDPETSAQVPIFQGGVDNTIQWVAPFACTLVAATITVNVTGGGTTRDAGTATAEVFKDSIATGLIATLDGTNTHTHRVTQAPGLDNIAIGDVIDFTYTFIGFSTTVGNATSRITSHIEVVMT